MDFLWVRSVRGFKLQDVFVLCLDWKQTVNFMFMLIKESDLNLFQFIRVKTTRNELTKNSVQFKVV